MLRKQHNLEVDEARVHRQQDYFVEFIYFDEKYLIPETLLSENYLIYTMNLSDWK